MKIMEKQREEIYYEIIKIMEKKITEEITMKLSKYNKYKKCNQRRVLKFTTKTI